MPSARSAVVESRRLRSDSSRCPSAMVRSRPRCTASRAAACARARRAASRSASSRATRPRRRRPRNARPLRSSSVGVDRLTDHEHAQRQRHAAARVSRCVPPQHGSSPAPTSGKRHRRLLGRRRARRPRATAPRRHRSPGRSTPRRSARGTPPPARPDRRDRRGVGTRGSAVPAPAWRIEQERAAADRPRRRRAPRAARRTRARADVGQRAGCERDGDDARAPGAAHVNRRRWRARRPRRARRR